MTPFPWEAAMQFGFGVLRLAPATFWSMTPRELGAAFNALNRTGAPLARTRFDELMNNFPDKEPDNGGR